MLTCFKNVCDEVGGLCVCVGDEDSYVHMCAYVCAQALISLY